MTSTGRLLSGAVKKKDGLAQALQEVLEAYAKLPEAERRAQAIEGREKPQQAPPPGGLVLTIYDRLLMRDSENRYRVAQGSDLNQMGNRLHGQRSSLWLTEEECKSIIPPRPQQGETHPVPSKLAKRIWLFGLLPYTPSFELAEWKPNSVRAGEIKLTVEEVSELTVRVRIHGPVLLIGPSSPDLLSSPGLGLKGRKDLENRYDAQLEGILVYDRARKTIAQWDMVALGDYTGIRSRAMWHGPDNPMRLGFAFKLDRSDYELPPERRRPRSMVHAYTFKNNEQYYWDPEIWEEDWKKQRRP